MYSTKPGIAIMSDSIDRRAYAKTVTVISAWKVQKPKRNTA
jgi:hypothetical protein